MVEVLKACGNDLTRDNIMKRAASIHDLKLPMLLPGITVSTSADDYTPIKHMQLERFDGTAGGCLARCSQDLAPDNSQ